MSQSRIEHRPPRVLAQQPADRHHRWAQSVTAGRDLSAFAKAVPSREALACSPSVGQSNGALQPAVPSTAIESLSISERFDSSCAPAREIVGHRTFLDHRAPQSLSAAAQSLGRARGKRAVTRSANGFFSRAGRSLVFHHRCSRPWRWVLALAQFGIIGLVLGVATPAWAVAPNFTRVGSFATRGTPIAIAASDLSRNGKLDIVTADFSSPGSVDVSMGKWRWNVPAAP
jgi:hypothetical protein